MSEHRLPRRPRFWWLTSVRVRAALALGVVLGFGTVGTFAFWTDEAVVNAGTLSAATLKIRVNDLSPYPATSLAMTAMVPGSTSAEVLTIKNVGTAPLKYTFTGGLGGTDAATFAGAGTGGLLVTIRQGGTKSGATCINGTVVFIEAPLTATTSTILLPKASTSVLGAANASGLNGGTEALCVQIKLSDSAATGLQGKIATATFSANATSDLS